MRVTFHGVRGSFPTPGPATASYGGNTSCVEVRLADGTLLVLDGGTGIRDLGRRVAAEEHRGPIHLLVTHLHWDHIIGVPFFAPVYRKETTLVLHPLAVAGAEQIFALGQIFDGLHFPLRMHQLPARIEQPSPTDGAWRIGSALVRRVRLNHPGGSTGFRIDDEGGASLVFLTDSELHPPGGQVTSPDALARFAEGASLLVHDAQYLDAELGERRGWGHSTVAQVLALGKQAGARRLALYHHDPDRDDAALDRIAEEARAFWAREVGEGEAVVAAEGLTVEL